MANKKFSDLTATTTLASGDLFAVETALGNSRKITKDNLRSTLLTGARAYVGTTLSAQNYSAAPAIPFNTESFDDAAYHDNVTNNSRITIPATGRYILSAGIQVGSSTLTASDYLRAFIRFDGAFGSVNEAAAITEISSVPGILLNLNTGPVSLTSGQYAEVILDTETDTSIDIVGTATWFAIMRVG